MFLPAARKLDGKKVLICDNVAFHISLKVLELSEANNVSFICLPPHSTHLTQPLDVAVFRSVKGEWRHLLSEWKENKENEVIKMEDMPSLFKNLLERIQPTITANIRSGFRTCGIYPTNVEELLKKIVEEYLLMRALKHRFFWL